MSRLSTFMLGLALVVGCARHNPAFDGDGELGTSGELGEDESGEGESGEAEGESTGDGDGDGDGESESTGDGDGDGDGESTGDGDGDSETTGDPCEPGLSECRGQCVNLDEDPLNCGMCGNVCDGECVGGQCQDGEVKLVFVTSEWIPGFMGEGLASADELCNSLAAQAGLDGEFMAWLSTAQLGPAARMQPFDGPYVLPDGQLVANGWADLVDGELAHPISVDESGQQQVEMPYVCEGWEVWTNTKLDGQPTSTSDCNGWTVSDGNLSGTFVGRSTVSDPSWTQANCPNVACAAMLPVYCVQQ